MTTEPAHRLERWEALERPFMNVLPFVLLVLSAAAAIGIDDHSPSKQIVDAAGAAAAAVWMFAIVTLHPRWAGRRTVMAVLFVGLMALSAVLVVNDAIFGFFSWTGYIWTYRLMAGNWRFLGVAATAAVTGTSQHGGLPGGSLFSWVGWILIIAVNFVIAGTVAWFTWVKEEQDERRRQAITELTEANAKLEAALHENAGLHAQLLEQAREAGVLDERQRMAREIHDTLAQGLVGIVTQLEAAGRPRTTDGEWGRHADAAIQLARDSLAEARRSVQALQPEPPDRDRLPEAIASVAEKWSTLKGSPRP